MRGAMADIVQSLFGE